MSLLKPGAREPDTDVLLLEINDVKDRTHKVQSQLKDPDPDSRIYRLQGSLPLIRKESSKYITNFKRNKLHKTLTDRDVFDVEDGIENCPWWEYHL